MKMNTSRRIRRIRRRRSTRKKSKLRQSGLGNMIGYGEQGIVYEDLFNKDIVIKCCGRPEDIINENIMNLVSIKNIGPKYYGFFKTDTQDNCYIQEKLFPINMEILESGGYNYELCNLVTNLINNGIFHNDMKFDNMLLSKDGELRLIDFDLASEISKYGFKHFDSSFKNNSVVLLENGEYISLKFTPEQIETIMKMRPLIEKTFYELDQENKLRQAREQARENMRLAAEKKLKKLGKK